MASFSPSVQKTRSLREARKIHFIPQLHALLPLGELSLSGLIYQTCIRSGVDSGVNISVRQVSRGIYKRCVRCWFGCKTGVVLIHLAAENNHNFYITPWYIPALVALSCLLSNMETQKMAKKRGFEHWTTTKIHQNDQIRSCKSVYHSQHSSCSTSKTVRAKGCAR